VNSHTSQPAEQFVRTKDNDGLHKRRGIWHYKLNVNGKWREFTTGTRNYQEARRTRMEATQAHTEGRMNLDFAKWPFRKAAEDWLEMRAGDNLAQNTRRVERERLQPLLKAFDAKRVCTFTLDDIKIYRAQRQAEVCPRTINLEVKVLRMVLQRAKCWGPIAGEYRPLKEGRKGPGIALTSEEERRLFETAASKPLWEAVYLAGVIAVNTTARGCELKGLRLQDVDFVTDTLWVRRESTKTDAGCRDIPLNEVAKWALMRLMRRAELLGATQPDHYLFPAYRFRYTKTNAKASGSGYDPNAPMRTWRTAWRSLKKTAGLPNLRFHDLRHTSITNLAEAGVPDHVLMSISGHISPEMIRHYSHIRSQAKRAAVGSIASYKPRDLMARSIPST
jgi:integrase